MYTSLHLLLYICVYFEHLTDDMYYSCEMTPTGIPRQPKGRQSDAQESPLGPQGAPKMHKICTKYAHICTNMHKMCTKCAHKIRTRASGPVSICFQNNYKKVPSLSESGNPEESNFNEILCFCGKWQTSFGLRLRSRIGVWASCFHSLGLYLCHLFFQCFFDILGGDPLTCKSGAGAASSPARALVSTQ